MSKEILRKKKKESSSRKKIFFKWRLSSNSSLFTKFIYMFPSNRHNLSGLSDEILLKLKKHVN